MVLGVCRLNPGRSGEEEVFNTKNTKSTKITEDSANMSDLLGLNGEASH
jgi:hypothetical protein